MLIFTLQVLTGALPSSGFSGPEAVFRVLGGERPSKPGNALELGLSDEVWKLLVDCWRTDRFSRPSIRDVSTCVKGAASACGILSSVGSIPQRYGDPDSDFPQFGRFTSPVIRGRRIHKTLQIHCFLECPQVSVQLLSPTCRALRTRGVDDEELDFTREYIPTCYLSSLRAFSYGTPSESGVNTHNSYLVA